jgi:hypothetical protein
VRTADAGDVAALTPDGPQLTVSAPLGANVHRLPTGAAVHLVNYDHDHGEDAVRRTGEVTLSVRLPGVARVEGAVWRPADGDAVGVDVRTDGGTHTVTLPDVGVYGILELAGARS